MKDTFVCFNNKQVQFVDILINLRLIKPTEAGGVRHPITNNTEILYQKYEANKFVSNIAQKIFCRLIDDAGKARYYRMLDCGAMKPATVSEEEIKAMGDICLSIPEY